MLWFSRERLLSTQAPLRHCILQPAEVEECLQKIEGRSLGKWPITRLWFEITFLLVTAATNENQVTAWCILR